MALSDGTAALHHQGLFYRAVASAQAESGKSTLSCAFESLKRSMPSTPARVRVAGGPASARSRPCCWLGDQLFDDLATGLRKLLEAAAVEVRELAVIQAK